MNNKNIRQSIRYITFPLIIFFTLFNTKVSSQELMAHNFDDGDFGPFEIVNNSMLDRIDFYNTRLYTNWTTSDYQNDNYSRKSEFRAANNAYTFQDEFWTGFSLWVRDDYMVHPTTGDSLDTDAGIMQIWGFDEDAGNWNHYAMLKFEGRNGGALTWYHKYGFNESTRADFLLYPNFPRNTWVDIIIRVDLSSNGGIVQIWADGQEVLDVSGQTIGWGEMNSSGQTGNSYSTPGSWGGYNYRSDGGCAYSWDEYRCFLGYTDGEARTLGFDNLSLWNGANGKDIVDPSNQQSTAGSSSSSSSSSSTSSSSSSSLVHMTKRNATGYAIDGNKGGDDAQNVYLWSSNTGNINQQWVEISRGGDYYSYQKRNTNYCLDGNNGGDDGQSVYLWTCDDDNYNQHWRKVNTGGDLYRLEKRNAPQYSIDGNHGGDDGQDLYLWTTQEGNQNQQWYFEQL